MKVEDWVVSVRYCTEDGLWPRRAVVGPARASTVEAMLHLASVPEVTRVEIRSDETLRKFVDGLLDPERIGYYVSSPVGSSSPWCVCIGSIHEVIR